MDDSHPLFNDSEPPEAHLARRLLTRTQSRRLSASDEIAPSMQAIPAAIAFSAGGESSAIDILTARGYPVLAASTLDEAAQHLDRSRVPVVILDLVRPPVESSERLIRRLRTRPHVRLLAYVPLTASAVRRLGRLCTDQLQETVVATDGDLVDAVRRVAALSPLLLVAEWRRCLLTTALHDVRSDLIEAHCDNVALAANVASVARQLGCSMRTLERHHAAAELVAPRKLQRIVRLLTAVRLLATARLPVRDVAVAAGFASPRDLREALGDLCGVRPGALRRNARATDVTLTLLDQLRPERSLTGFASRSTGGLSTSSHPPLRTPASAVPALP